MPESGTASPPRPEVVAATDPKAIARACEALRAGRIVAIPTETVYGLAVLPRGRPLARLVAAKRRSRDKGIVLLVDSLDQVAQVAILPEAARQLAARHWPGALTLVLPIRDDVRMPGLLSGGRDTIGVRLSDHPVPRSLARAVGPIATSSANRSGRPPATTVDELLISVGHVVDLVIDGGPSRAGVPSTVVSVGADDRLQVLRHGAITLEAG